MCHVDWMEFVASVVGSLAWPIAVIVAAMLFRRQVGSLLDRLRRGEVLGAKWDFGEGIADVESQLQVVEGAPTGPVLGGLSDEELARAPVGQFDRLAKEADEYPTYVVITAWELVRGSLFDLVLRLGPAPTSRYLSAALSWTC
jgi:hypothetical protein